MVDVVAEHIIGDGDDGAVHRDFCCSACQFAGLGTGGVAGVWCDYCVPIVLGEALIVLRVNDCVFALC